MVQARKISKFSPGITVGVLNFNKYKDSSRRPRLLVVANILEQNSQRSYVFPKKEVL